MIGKDKDLRRVCAHFEQVENYYEAVADEEQLWELHHRREIDELKSAQQLKDEGRYFDVTPSEVIFLSRSEHRRMHIENALPESRKKMSEAHKGENHPMFGKHRSAETRKKISEAMSGEKHPMFGKPGTMLGTYWWNNGIIAKLSKEQPGPDFVRGRLKSNK